jgi:hypothetical protein
MVPLRFLARDTSVGTAFVTTTPTHHELPRTAERTEIKPKIVWTEPRPPTTSIELNHEWDRTGSHKDPPSSP